MHRADCEGGYVTLGALAISALAAAFMLGSLSAPRPTLGRAAIALDGFETDVLLESGLALASARLASAEDRGERSVVIVEEAQLAGGIVGYDIRPEAARVDLNMADAELLAGLFESAGATSMPADTFAAAVVSQRGRASFKSPGELSAIEALSGADLARIRPHVTVYSGLASVDVNGADPVVLRAIAQFGPNAVNDIADTRRTAEKGDGSTPASILGAHGRYLATDPAIRYRIALKAVGKSGQRAAAQAIVDLHGETPWPDILAFVPEQAGGAMP